jgi:hypothetical protein
MLVRKDRVVKIVFAEVFLFFLLGFILWNRPQETQWTCPESLEQVTHMHSVQVELGFSPPAQDAMLQKYYEKLCQTLRLRDEIVATDAYSRIGEYIVQHNALTVIRKQLGYWQEIEKQPEDDYEALRLWFVALDLSDDFTPVEFQWVKCEVPGLTDYDQCWETQITTAEFRIYAELFGASALLMVDAKDFSFTRSCSGLEPESAHLLWDCPFSIVTFHPGGWTDPCHNMYATWLYTGIATYYRPDHGEMCGPVDPLPPVDVIPDSPLDPEWDPEPTDLPPGWSHL